MIKSMTGFGKGEFILPGGRKPKGKITVEIKTVNHKFLDVSLKLPLGMSIFEDRVKDVIQKNIKRGKINISVSYDGHLLKEGRVVIDQKTARRYYMELSKLEKSLGLKNGITVKDLAALPGVVSYEIEESKIAALWPEIKTAIDRTIAKLSKDREKEGRALFVDLNTRAKNIKSLLKIIRSRAHLNIEEYRRKFNDRIKDLTGGRTIDMGRLEVEVAIFAKNSDITEEITRLDNHLVNFGKTITEAGEVGKKIDFIAQELHRETNTIGSKASDFKISKSVIEIKGEIEKIREQAKNLE
jgi:uncharacterized protein (TIGR00255 family)